MKLFKLYITLMAALMFWSCDQDLPYPLEDVRNGVVIDIYRADGSTAVLSQGSTDGDFRVKLTIPTQQGDYSMMDHAQLLCVLKTADQEWVSIPVGGKITSFPAEVALNIEEAYTALGIEGPFEGQEMYFTTNVTLNDGFVIKGWTPETDFNNTNMTGWRVDGRSYSYSVRYPVVCPFLIDEFTGTSSMVDLDWWEAIYDVEIEKISDTELQVSGLFEEVAPNGIFVITVNPETYTVDIPKQKVIDGTVWNGSYTNMCVAGSGTLDACSGVIKFNLTITVDQGSYGSYGMTIRK